MRGTRLAAFALAGALALTLAPRGAHATPARPDSLAPTFSRRDVAFALGAGALGALAAAHDRVWSAQASRDRSLATDRLARLGENLGGPYAAAPALLATDGLARLTGHTGLAAASERVALAGAVALGTTFALKEAIGRTRPDEPPHASDHFDAFSGHDALPSAHATLAFAMAGAISSESRSRWAPAALYPAATLVAWARVHERRHWPSDVVAGAVIGDWVARKVDRIARRRLPDGLLVLVWPAARGAHAEVRARF